MYFVLKLFVLLYFFGDNAESSGIRDALRNITLDIFFRIRDNTIPVNTIEETDVSYDYIIVGSGAAASVLANRLSTNRNVTVLLISDGFRESVAGKVPLFTELVQMTNYNHHFKMNRQEGVCEAMEENRCVWSSGVGLGGDTLLNYMTYIRGSKEDHDRMAKEVNDASWNYENLLPLYKKSERVTLTAYDAAYHGTSGEMPVEDVFQTNMSQVFAEAGVELGHKLGDYNANPLVFSRLQGMTKDGKRETSPVAFLKPIAYRSNLHILINADSFRVLIKNGTATGVEFRKKDRANKLYTKLARKQVIVSAGALESPKVLMRSGVGPGDILNKFGIKVESDLPVGENLQDHICYIGLTILANESFSNLLDFLDPSNLANMDSKSVLSSLAGFEAVGFVATNSSENGEPSIGIFPSGLGSYSTDKGLFNRKAIGITDEFYSKTFEPLEGKKTASFFVKLYHPKSKGKIVMTSHDKSGYSDFSHIGNWYTDSEGHDQKIMLEGVRYVQKIIKTAAMQKVGATLSPIPIYGCENFTADSDEYWRCAFRKLTNSAFQYSGTCKMGSANDASAVVTSDFKVKGVGKLMVVDESILPFSMIGDVSVLGMLVAEKCAENIRSSAN